MSAAVLPTRRAAELVAQPPEQRWLIQHLWGRSACGIIGGAPKSCKSWLGLEMAVSVATATPCLGRFEVDHPGTVLVYLAEDPLPAVRTRLDALCAHRGVDIDALDLHAIDTASLRLDLEEHQHRLHATCAALRPRMLLLDPLIRMHRLDENSSSDISRLLGFLTELQRSFELAVVLVHHASKKHRAHPGQALRGSSDLHAWGASNAYLARNHDHLVLTLEHRAAKPPEPMAIELYSTPDGAPTHLALRAGALLPDADPAPLTDQIIALLTAQARPLLRKELRASLTVNNLRLGQALQQLEDRGRVQRTPTGWLAHGHPDKLELHTE